jgi:hypothetical protein
MLAIQTGDAKTWHPGCAPEGTLDEDGNLLASDATPIYEDDDWFVDDSELCAKTCGKPISRAALPPLIRGRR